MEVDLSEEEKIEVDSAIKSVEKSAGEISRKVESFCEVQTVAIEHHVDWSVASQSRDESDIAKLVVWLRVQEHL